jgi:very-short-patch-repair endonuclease
MRLVTHPLLVSTLKDLAKRGRPGIALMRTLIGEREGHHRPTESGLESRLEHLARQAGVGGFVRQVDTGGEDTWLGRVDFRHCELPVVVFVDSERYHSALIDVRRDEEQRAALNAAGFVVVRVTDVDVWNRGPEVIAKLRGACERARAAELAVQIR